MSGWGRKQKLGTTRRRRVWNLLLERMEDRVVPAVFGVTSFADSGAGTLRQAILNANANPGPDQISFNIVTDPVSLFAAAQIVDPTAVTQGADGNLWFGVSSPAAPGIGRMNPNGVLLGFFALPAGSQPNAVTLGPDGRIWFTDRNPAAPSVRAVDTSGVFSGTFPLAAGSVPTGITTGSDNALWISNSSVTNPGIARVTVGGVISQPRNFAAGVTIPSITTGPDGNLWFPIDEGPAQYRIGQLTVSNLLNQYPDPNVFQPLPGEPTGITSIPGDAVYFARNGVGATPTDIGRITSSGGIPTFLNLTSVANGTINSLTTSSANQLWFTVDNGGSPFVAQVVGANLLNLYPVSAGSLPMGIGPGPDGTVWFAESNTDRIGRVDLRVTIQPVTALPTITEQVNLDAYTQFGAVRRIEQDDVAVRTVILDGSLLGAADGLTIQGDNSVVQGLQIRLFTGSGVVIAGADSRGNVIEGNAIFSNTEDGVRVLGSNNLVGGAQFQSVNAIFANGRGVWLDNVGSEGNLVEGNTIAGNLGEGVRITGSNNVIGGTSSGKLNLLNSNERGVLITGARASGNRVQGNLIGVFLDDQGRTIVSGNRREGVRIENASGNVVGGSGAGTRNIISGNNQSDLDGLGNPNLSGGVMITGAGSFNNAVSGNYIGTDAQGSDRVIDITGRLIGNNLNGVVIDNAADNRVGGTQAGEGNLISNNRGDGVRITGVGATRNLVQANLIGTDVAGALDTGNTLAGVVIAGAPGNTIGGAVAAASNLISGNQSGVRLEGAGASNNLVQGNRIGTNFTGNTALGNAQDGILVLNAPSNLIGGTTSTARNTVSGNLVGIHLQGAGTTGNTVAGNSIGLGGDGSSVIGNSTEGVLIDGGATGNLVGGVVAAAGNSIAFNAGAGVRVNGGGSIGNSILSNLINSNGLLGIQLTGGGNGNQTAPMLTSALAESANVTVTGVLNSLANSSFRLQFFASASGDPTGFGEGERYLAETTITTDGAGIGSFQFTFTPSPALPLGVAVSATATAINSGNTSSFASNVVLATQPNTQAFVVVNTNDGGPGSLRQAILNANATLGADTIVFNIPGTGPFTISPTSELPAITEAVRIQGLTQPGSSVNQALIDESSDAVLQVVLSGALAGSANGLIVRASNSVINGLVINRFSGAGIWLDGPNAVNNLVFATYIGTDASGNAQLGNGGEGILITGPNNRVGGNTEGFRSIIRGNRVGIAISSSTGVGNQVEGNFILDNRDQGVLVQSSNNSIGSLTNGRNVISGNGLQGVLIVGSAARGNAVLDNVIGADITGETPRPNRAEGVLIDNAPANRIGEAGTNGGNVIGGNVLDGIRVTGAGSVGAVIRSNFVGFNEVRDLIVQLPNRDGVRLESSGTTVGGSNQPDRNIISLNDRHGISISGAAASGNVILGNFIGTNDQGLTDFGNAFSGIFVDNAPGNTIGGTTETARNLISGNTVGITLQGAGSFGNLIVGNYIGTANDGATDLGNATDGVLIDNAPGNVIGGTITGARNVISGNDRGIRIIGAGATSNTVSGNYIGLDFNGVNALGNSLDGVRLEAGAFNNLIGGDTSASSNRIAFNGRFGVVVEGASTIGDAVLSNRVFSNGSEGIALLNGGNLDQPAPMLTTAFSSESTLTTSISGVLNAAANAAYRIQFFTNAIGTSIQGQGANLLGDTVVRTDALGLAAISFSITPQIALGTVISSTATLLDSTGAFRGTSEFSSNLSVTPTPIPRPFVVNTALDVVDPNDGVLSLREAILQANASPGPDDVVFSIPGTGPFNIRPQSPLPVIQDSMSIFGYTQPGSSANTNPIDQTPNSRPLVVIDGSLAGSGVDGLVVRGANTLISGLVIDNFSGAGIWIDGEQTRNTWVWGCHIGTDPTGALQLGNGAEGIRVTAPNNRVGGNSPSLRNLIYNNGVGVSIASAAGTGNLIEGNHILNSRGEGVLVLSSNNVVGGLSDGRNVISGGGSQGIRVFGPAARGAQIQGNLIGTAPNGLRPLSNAREGILIEDAPGAVVGGITENARNVVAANGLDGIRVTGTNARFTTIQGNYLGFNLQGGTLFVLGNRDGIRVESSDNLIGGDSTGARNVVAVNTRDGISLSGPLATRNTVIGNFVGTITNGATDFGNTRAGIFLDNAPGNIIGGVGETFRNVIPGNNVGILIQGAEATGNQVLGNSIGLSSNGVDDLGNATDGLQIIDAPGNIIGGVAAGAGNTISGNDRGILVRGAGARNNVFQGNRIGLAVDSDLPVGNDLGGILITGGAQGNIFGGEATGAGNRVWFNRGPGVIIDGATTISNPILSNSLFDNQLEGIVLANGGNANSPAPTLSSATSAGASLTIRGTMTAAPNSIYIVQFFSSPTADASGAGEGRDFLGSTVVSTNAAGSGSILYSFATSLAIPTGQFISATATDALLNTSAFAINTLVQAEGEPSVFVVTNTSATGFGSLRQAILDANARAGLDRIVFAIPGSGPHTIRPLSVSPLPAITDGVVIDGYTEAGTSTNTSPIDEGGNAVLRIILNGALTGPGTDGLLIRAANTIVRGLVINQFPGDGIEISGPDVSGVKIEGNYVGTDVTGTVFAGLGNGLNGVYITSAGNMVGSLDLACRNIIAGNLRGVFLDGAGATGNRVYNTVLRDNQLEGVRITASNSTIGRDTSNGDNRIFKNGQGVVVAGPSARNNLVENNQILTNGNEGVLIDRAPANTINANVISDNVYGVVVTGASATANRLTRNLIGTDAACLAAFGNRLDGVVVRDAPGNSIGLGLRDDGNFISGNLRHGLVITGAGSTGNSVLANRIGTDRGGNNALPNTFDGVRIEAGASSNIVGDPREAARNVISANNQGVRIVGATTSGNTISNNVIGIGLDGTTPLGNAFDGIRIEDSPGNLIGGSEQGAGNRIGDNVRGVFITGSNAQFNRLLGNFIGVDVDGNPLGNSEQGVLVDSASNNRIGGLDEGEGNCIAFNRSGQVVVRSGTGNGILSNQIKDPAGLEYGIDLGDDGRTPNDFQDPDPGANLLQNFPTLSSVRYNGSETIIKGTLNSLPNRRFLIQFFSNPTTGQLAITAKPTLLGTIEVNTNSEGGVAFEARFAARVPSGDSVNATATDPNFNSSEFSGAVRDLPGEITFQVGDFQVLEGGVATITVVRSGTEGTVTVNYATANGTAVAGVDYVSAAGVLIFLPGEDAKTFTVTTIDNAFIAPDKTVLLNLSNPTGGATLGPGRSGTLTIINDDLPRPGTLQLSSSTYVASENIGSVTILVTRTNGNDGTVTINYATVDGTAKAGLDYVAVAGTLVFGPGESFKTFAVPIIDDAAPEELEYFSVVLSSPGGGAELGAPATARVNIPRNDQDVTPPTVKDVRFQTAGHAITAIQVAYSESMESSSVVDLRNYSYSVQSAGPDGRFNTQDDILWYLSQVVSNDAAFSVTLLPVSPLPFQTLFQLVINQAELNPNYDLGVRDLAGNLLDGDNDGRAGGRFLTTFAVGANLTYLDARGDQVNLRLNRGGQIQLLRNPSGEANTVRLVTTKAGQSELTGSVRRPRRGGDGRTVIDRLEGTAGVRVRLNPNQFLIRSVTAASASTPQPHTVDAVLEANSQPGLFSRTRLGRARR